MLAIFSILFCISRLLRNFIFMSVYPFLAFLMSSQDKMLSQNILQHCSSSCDRTWPPRTIQPLSGPSQHNLCVLLQVEIVSTWVGTARTNTPKLKMASTRVSSWVFKPIKMGREVSCLFCVSEVMYGPVSMKLFLKLVELIHRWFFV